MIGKCSRCSRETRLEAPSLGLCLSCYNYLHHDRVKAKKRRDKWRRNHRDYWDKYCEENKERLKQYARDYYRKKNNVPEYKWRIKEE